jgi:hypothetical protein
MVVTGAVLASGLTVGTPSAAAQPVSGPVIEHMRPTLPWIRSRPAAGAHAQRDHDRAATRLRLPTGLGTAAVLPGDLAYHGGFVLHNPTVHLIFWLPPGRHFEPQDVEPGGSDARYENLIVRYFQDLSGSSFNNILIQYCDKQDCIHNSVTLGQWGVDATTPYPRAGTQADPLLDSDIQDEVKGVMQHEGWAAGPDTVIFVYTAFRVESCFDLSRGCSFPTRAGNTYAGYHSSYLANGWTVPYANMPVDAHHFLDIPHSPNNDPIADQEISLTSHEQFEMETDPDENKLTGQAHGWFDATYQEIGDKCQNADGSYNYVNVNPDGSNVVMNGHPYILQGEWSNYQHGCALQY